MCGTQNEMGFMDFRGPVDVEVEHAGGWAEAPGVIDLNVDNDNKRGRS